MKFLVCSSLVLLVVTRIYSVPHHGHDHKSEKNCTKNVTDHPHDGHTHADSLHAAAGSHTAGHTHHHHPSNETHEHAETKSQHENQTNCHQEPILVDCSGSSNGSFVFKHLNDTHHECSALETGKCSSSSNAFESLELCEKACHHDGHHPTSNHQ